MRLPLCFARQFAQIQPISIGSIICEAHIHTWFLPRCHISLHQHRASSNTPHRQYVRQKSLHCDPPTARILQTGFGSSPERTSAPAHARMILCVHLSLGPGKAYCSGRVKIFLSVPGSLDAVAGIPFIAGGHCTNSRSSGHNLALTEIQTLSCDKKVGPSRIFLHSLYRFPATSNRYGEFTTYSRRIRRSTVREYAVSPLTSSPPSQMKVISPLANSRVQRRCSEEPDGTGRFASNPLIWL